MDVGSDTYIETREARVVGDDVLRDEQLDVASCGYLRLVGPAIERDVHILRLYIDRIDWNSTSRQKCYANKTRKMVRETFEIEKGLMTGCLTNWLTLCLWHHWTNTNNTENDQLRKLQAPPSCCFGGFGLRGRSIIPPLSFSVVPFFESFESCCWWLRKVHACF